MWHRKLAWFIPSVLKYARAYKSPRYSVWKDVLDCLTGLWFSLPRSHLGSVSGVCPARNALSLTHFSVLTWHFRLQSHHSEHHRTHTRRGWPWGWQVIHSTNIYSMPGIVLVTGDTATNTPWFRGASVPIIGIRQEYRNKHTDVDMCLKENFKRKGSERWWREGGHLLRLAKRKVHLVNELHCQ